MFKKIFNANYLCLLNVQLRAVCLMIFFMITALSNVYSQVYPPAAQLVGSTAMHKDSSVFVAWANQCSVTRGLQDISSPSLGLASAGQVGLVTGKADGVGALSLGDGGIAICEFVNPITNGFGFDFAVFENSFNDDFLELAFVEVSSDGINYVRFPSHSLSDTNQQCGTFGNSDASKINNLAGKYRAGYGTPFDLQELAGKAGLDINRITHVKLIDVIGSLNKAFATYDSFGNKINDPWPTPFPQGGFDLDAIGVIHQNTIIGMDEQKIGATPLIYPNPVQQGGSVFVKLDVAINKMELYDMNGALITATTNNYLSTHTLTKGLYYLNVLTAEGSFKQKLLVF